MKQRTNDYHRGNYNKIRRILVGTDRTSNAVDTYGPQICHSSTLSMWQMKLFLAAENYTSHTPIAVEPTHHRKFPILSTFYRACIPLQYYPCCSTAGAIQWDLELMSDIERGS